jgi:hypothetical protein
MASRRATASLAMQASQLTLAVPQVVAHRVTRMALAGPLPSRRDRAEFLRMGQEKSEAFLESWKAMTVAATQANQRIALSFFRSMWTFPATLPMASAKQWQSATVEILGKGLAPVKGRAVANASGSRAPVCDSRPQATGQSSGDRARLTTNNVAVDQLGDGFWGQFSQRQEMLGDSFDVAPLLGEQGRRGVLVRLRSVGDSCMNEL